MKKKFLSLMMAAAVVATTSVSAFAEDTKQLEILDTVGKQTQVTVTGKVTDNQGGLPANTISVTVPTSAQFTVNEQGKIIAPEIEITSDNDEEVQVTAYKFSDPTGAEKINIVGAKTGLNLSNDTNEKKGVYLTLVGKTGSVILKSTDSTKSGLMKLNGTDEYGLEADSDSGVEANPELGNVSKGNPLKLKLEGETAKGYVPPTSPISENFTLTLKIKKLK